MHRNLCPAAEPIAGPCHRGPCCLAALLQKMTHPSPWRVCPPWGWVFAASAGLLLVVGLCVSLLMCAKDVAYTSEGVLDWSMALTLITIGGHLAIAQNLSVTLADLRILIFTGGILLLVRGFGFAAGFLAIISDLGLGRA